MWGAVWGAVWGGQCGEARTWRHPPGWGSYHSRPADRSPQRPSHPGGPTRQSTPGATSGLVPPRSESPLGWPCHWAVTRHVGRQDPEGLRGFAGSHGAKVRGQEATGGRHVTEGGAPRGLRAEGSVAKGRRREVGVSGVRRALGVVDRPERGRVMWGPETANLGPAAGSGGQGPGGGLGGLGGRRSFGCREEWSPRDAGGWRGGVHMYRKPQGGTVSPPR